jgi:hypothetical protein
MVELDTLYTLPYDTFRNIINSNVSDPKRNQTNSNRRWIYRDVPDTTSHNFAGYPFIVINHSDLNNDRVIVLNNTLKENELIFDIEVHAEFDDPKARCDTISSAVLSAALSVSAMDTMQTVGLFSPRIVSSRTTITSNANKEIIIRSISIAFEVDIRIC